MKRKTSIVIDTELWSRWIKFVVGLHGSTRRLSDEIEKALMEYMMKGSYRFSADELREKLDIKKLRYNIEVPEGLGRRILDSRRKRVFSR